MITGPDIPACIERSKIGGFPLGYAWGREQYSFGHGWATDGSRPAIVRKLEPLSVRAILVTAMWVGAVDPRLVNPPILTQTAPMTRQRARSGHACARCGTAEGRAWRRYHC